MFCNLRSACVAGTAHCAEYASDLYVEVSGSLEGVPTLESKNVDYGPHAHNCPICQNICLSKCLLADLNIPAGHSGTELQGRVPGDP